MCLRYWLPLAVLLGSCTSFRTPIGFWSRNGISATGERHGPWREYFDEAETRLVSRGRYQHGRPVGRWRYYSYSGQLDHDDRYRRNGRVLIRYFHPHGPLARRGQARMVVSADTVHYYWYGRWQLYDSLGKPDGWENYAKGQRVAAGKD